LMTTGRQHDDDMMTTGRRHDDDMMTTGRRHDDDRTTTWHLCGTDPTSPQLILAELISSEFNDCEMIQFVVVVTNENRLVGLTTCLHYVIRVVTELTVQPTAF